MSDRDKILLVIIILVITSILCLVASNNLEKFEVEEKSKEIEIISNKKVSNTEWTITQFGENDNGQMMSFTIEGNNDGLVIIDGGYRDNEDQYNFLMNKISEHNNIVDAWIVTHFDTDHGGEFVRIVQMPEVTVRKIYVPDTPEDMEVLKSNLDYEEEWDVYEEYMSLNLPQKIKVHNGNKFKLIGLKMKVLCSYEDWIDEECNNLLNNGAMVFKLYGKEESLLFCGDVQDPVVGNFILENYKDDLKSDYFQIPHHGNTLLSEEFYRAVSPKIVFFCAPDWLINNISDIPWFTVKENKAFLESLGAKCLWHNTSPNILNFK